MSNPCKQYFRHFCALFMGLWLLVGVISPSYAQNPGLGGVEPQVRIDVTPLPRDPCEDAYKKRSSVTIGGRFNPSVRTSPSAGLPADGTLGCPDPYAPPYAIEPLERRDQK